MNQETDARKPAVLRHRLVALLSDFEEQLKRDDLRDQVKALVPALHLFQDLGSSLIPDDQASSAQERILYYLQKYPFQVIAGEELAVVSGISEYGRRVRELHVEQGWPIYSGKAAKAMLDAALEDGDEGLFEPRLTDYEIRSMKAYDYVMVGDQDRDAALRWNVANDIRKLDLGMKERLLRYFRRNVGRPVTGEELEYVANSARTWPRRVRELRTEEGWPIATRLSGRPDLPVGSYVLEADRQAEQHDRAISDAVRVAVLERDDFRCRCCGWSPQEEHSDADPRTLLELHHADPHASGGSNDSENLFALCNVHHDEVHRLKLSDRDSFLGWLKRDCG